MAIIVNGHCVECDKDFIATVGSGSPTPLECPSCVSIRKDMERRKYFGGLDGLTIEERLRKIEKWIYDYKPYREPRF